MLTLTLTCQAPGDQRIVWLGRVDCVRDDSGPPDTGTYRLLQTCASPTETQRRSCTLVGVPRQAGAWGLLHHALTALTQAPTRCAGRTRQGQGCRRRGQIYHVPTATWRCPQHVPPPAGA